MTARPYAPAPQGWGRVRIANIGLVAVLALLLALSVLVERSLDGEAMPADSWSLTTSTDEFDEGPLPGLEEAAAPLGTPLAAPQGGGPHAFLRVQDDGVTPVTYDPCRPIHYVVRPDHEPAGGRALLHASIAQISAVTGLRFVYDGETTEAPSHDRSSYQPDRYGDRWAPVLVSWATGAEVPDFAGDVVGLASSRDLYTATGTGVYVTGAVELDADWFATALADTDARGVARGIVLHELGHLVGLDHVDDPAEVMAPGGAQTDLAEGDLTGLAQLGAGECAPDL
ncbi:Peptidase metallopeptidase [Modestobacter italicus]|uniref:Peptidase metallopeptidase n=1 Tax=Modestobacter italicus (strain DSM 44449 / CECT 9708 / BC 501) TaxID=2732864 RepID=I4F1H9_MODI5|nr:matrixin family metalloprotease [Modestobacter marinus]CCH89492.1 Peptidase metallopeptidase [Modestobacter marinus]